MSSTPNFFNNLDAG